MSKMLKQALQEQRKYYAEKLLAIGVYNEEIVNNMTITELEKEYQYFFLQRPSIKKKSKLP
ncbi:stress protein [Bacillus sp. FJAT-47783]|uniref:stress protein n=1 Tax=Bacillus sp. FJAT-47783 TaxID=2922712 RepID=UPI001FACB840|nr:stress protein [Bacillus sp. FJAT-47783]